MIYLNQYDLKALVSQISLQRRSYCSHNPGRILRGRSADKVSDRSINLKAYQELGRKSALRSL